MATRKRVIIMPSLYAGAMVLIILVAWHVTDPTFRAYSNSDSPNGRNCCAIFHDVNRFRFAVFEKGWHWRELPGERGELYTDSLDLTDIQYTWTGDTVTVTGSTGADSTHTIIGQFSKGRQSWH